MYSLPANGLRTRVAKAMVQTPCGLPAGLAMCPMLQSLAETISFGLPLPPNFIQVSSLVYLQPVCGVWLT